jgi:hypothetical protein
MTGAHQMDAICFEVRSITGQRFSSVMKISELDLEQKSDILHERDLLHDLMSKISSFGFTQL